MFVVGVSISYTLIKLNVCQIREQNPMLLTLELFFVKTLIITLLKFLSFWFFLTSQNTKIQIPTKNYKSHHKN